ncbi:hypothetical protein V8G54_008206 [Vigna mungo]|uniref:Uncharacterized protein n=1 Tax=Vigna mungo TaxID=3915 RepID=A0AAQ3S9S8_VIGMU
MCLLGAPLQNNENLFLRQRLALGDVERYVTKESHGRNLNHLLSKVNQLNQVLGTPSLYDGVAVVLVEVVFRACKFVERNCCFRANMGFSFVKEPHQWPNQSCFRGSESSRQITNGSYARYEQVNLFVFYHSKKLIQNSLCSRGGGFECRASKLCMLLRHGRYFHQRHSRIRLHVFGTLFQQNRETQKSP